MSSARLVMRSYTMLEQNTILKDRQENKFLRRRGKANRPDRAWAFVRADCQVKPLRSITSKMRALARPLALAWVDRFDFSQSVIGSTV